MPRPPAGSRPRRHRRRLSAGGRPRTIFDYIELIVARLIGRDLGEGEGCLVQVAAAALLFAIVYVLAISGVLAAALYTFSQWYVHLTYHPGAPTPTP